MTLNRPINSFKIVVQIKKGIRNPKLLLIHQIHPLSTRVGSEPKFSDPGLQLASFSMYKPNTRCVSKLRRNSHSLGLLLFFTEFHGECVSNFNRNYQLFRIFITSHYAPSEYQKEAYIEKTEA